jgi:hypothetical protein
MSENLQLAEKLSRILQIPLSRTQSPPAATLQVGTIFWVFPEGIESRNNPLLVKQELAAFIAVPPPDDATLCRYVLPHFTGGITRLQLGHEVVSAKFAINDLLDLPATFEQTQTSLIEEALRPVANGGLIKTRAIYDNISVQMEERPDDAASLLNLLICGTGSTPKLIFVEAEAGKGKTILLASVTRDFRENSDKFAIYIPLRKLPIQAGIGLRDIMQLIGVVGAGAGYLEKAIQNGLVTLFLDGIDEVSGRYDRSLISDLLSDLTRRLHGPDTVLVLSGRKTEARQLSGEWQIMGLDLPSPMAPEFRQYVEMVVDQLLSEWDECIHKLPREFDELFGTEHVDRQARRERDTIIDWIVSVFPAVGKDPSLFFAQGLAAIGIGARIGNRKQLQVGRGLYVPEVVDVCRAATVFACLREQSKVDDVARDTYSTEAQMAALRSFAILASATKMLPNLPTPNEIAQKVFAVDTVNNPEVYTAIVRQNAKHALLYATEGAVGSYRPRFLSDWIRNAFLAEAVSSADHPCGIDPSDIPPLVATADRAHLAFSSLLPDALGEQDVPKSFADTLVAETQAGSELACANLWQLRASIGDLRMGVHFPGPLPLSQIDRAEFIGCVIDGDLNGDSYFLDDSTFEGCTIKNCIISGASMPGVNFRSCHLEDIKLTNQCQGPILFEACTLAACTFQDMVSSGSPALYFVDCRFEGNKNEISQKKPAYGEAKAAPLVQFRNCTSAGELDALFVGEWLHLGAPVQGIKHVPVPKPDLAAECLREMLRTFFPSRMGSAGEMQARDYIRLSALGRGCLPAGSPTKSELQTILESVGFAPGGRSDHMYAPWSSVLGGGEHERMIRSEMINFMQDNNARGQTIQILLNKLEKNFP